MAWSAMEVSGHLALPEAPGLRNSASLKFDMHPRYWCSSEWRTAELKRSTYLIFIIKDLQKRWAAFEVERAPHLNLLRRLLCSIEHLDVGSDARLSQLHNAIGCIETGNLDQALEFLTLDALHSQGASRLTGVGSLTATEKTTMIRRSISLLSSRFSELVRDWLGAKHVVITENPRDMAECGWGRDPSWSAQMFLTDVSDLIVSGDSITFESFLDNL